MGAPIATRCQYDSCSETLKDTPSVNARTAARRLWLVHPRDGQLVPHLGALIVRIVSEGVDASGIEVHIDSGSVDRSAVLAVGAQYRRRYTLELAALRCSQSRDQCEAPKSRSLRASSSAERPDARLSLPSALAARLPPSSPRNRRQLTIRSLSGAVRDGMDRRLPVAVGHCGSPPAVWSTSACLSRVR